MTDIDVIKSRMRSETKLKRGDEEKLRRRQWMAILHAMDILDHATADDIRLRAIQVLSQAVAIYWKILVEGEQERRLKELEKWRGELEKRGAFGGT